MENQKKILIFSQWQGVNFNDITEKSQLWMFRNYEAYFDQVYYVLLGPKSRPKHQVGAMTCISLGTGNTKRDLLLAPFRLYKTAKKIRPNAYVTPEMIFGWWIGLLVKILLRGKIYLFPYAMPETNYKVTGRSFSGLPIWFERLLIKLNFLSVDKVLTAKGLPGGVNWLKKEEIANRKLIIGDVLPESTLPPYFFEQLRNAVDCPPAAYSDDPDLLKLLWVGRIFREKMLDDLVRMMEQLKGQISVHLYIVGPDDGEKANLHRLAAELGVEDMISYLGYISNGELPKYFLHADVFASPATGNSFREAAFCGLPIVAYQMDWVEGIPNNDDAFILVPEGDYKAMAEAIIRLKNDPGSHRKLSERARKLAWELWSPDRLENSLRNVFEETT
jgi:glycosyltransferase involved in cell wall biosynthesis